MGDTKVTTIRQDQDQAAALDAVARIDGVPVSEVIRQAIAGHIESRRNDPEFQERLRRRLEEDREILEKLADR